MRVGLLVCDEVREEYREEFGDYPGMFQWLFPNYDFQVYNVFKGEFPASVDDCEVYMSTGSSHSVYEDLAWIHQTKAFIKNIFKANKYFIGFCFGHQLMAEALGGKVAKAPAGWCVGVQTFDVYKIKPWMRPAKTQVNYLLMCQDQVMVLPKNTQRIAGNADCPNAILQVGERMMSIQAHPEFSKAYDQTLMKGRVERIGAETVAKGIESLKMDIDVSIFRQWVNAFLQK